MSDVTVTLSLKDMEPVKLLLWELIRLRDDMIVAANPEAERLTKIIDRFGRLEDDRA